MHVSHPPFTWESRPVPEELNLEVLRQVERLYPDFHKEGSTQQKVLVSRVQKFVQTGEWK